MTAERIKEIQQQTAYPDSVSVQQALMKVWNEVVSETYTEEQVKLAITLAKDSDYNSTKEIIQSLKQPKQ